MIRTTPSSLTPSEKHARHIVRLYNSSEFLFGAVGAYLREGLARGEAVIVVATERHRAGFEQHLVREGIDLNEARARGDFIELDALATLNRLMPGGLGNGLPDAAVFQAVVAAEMARALETHAETGVRAYGEMVDVLLEVGNEAATLQLEELWNDLMGSFPFPFQLYCSYRVDRFDRAQDRRFREICGQHANVLPAESFDESADGDEQRRTIANLQQAAAALESEIARRCAMEEALRRREQELTDLVETASIGMHWLDVDGTILWANQAELDALGYGRDEYVGHNIREFHADSEVIETVLKRLSEGGHLHDFEVRMRAKDDTFRHMLVNSSAYCEDGRFVHTRCFLRDVTNQTMLDRALCLERERLREANRKKDEFLAMLSHELRNPLAPILTALDLMDMRGDTDSKQEREVIRRQARHLAGLIEDLLDISRVSSGKVRLRRERSELYPLVARAIEMASPLFEERMHALNVNVPREGCLVDADPIRLPQVFANLLMNAAKYTSPGGRISVMARREGYDLVVTVADDGIGIAPEMLGSLFEPFVQGGRTIDRSQGGLGLGLALVRSLTQLHGGSVSAESDGPGKGSRFKIRLPARSKGDPAPEAPARPSTNGHRRLPDNPERVLVVDDNADCAIAFAEVVRRLGHEVKVAYNGHQAIELATAFRPTMALVDIGLPSMDGYELARRLKEGSSEPLRLIAVTGYGEESDRARSREAGFDLHTVKPVDLENLRALLERDNGEPASNGNRIS